MAKVKIRTIQFEDVPTTLNRDGQRYLILSHFASENDHKSEVMNAGEFGIQPISQLISSDADNKIMVGNDGGLYVTFTDTGGGDADGNGIFDSNNNNAIVQVQRSVLTNNWLIESQNGQGAHYTFAHNDDKAFILNRFGNEDISMVIFNGQGNWLIEVDGASGAFSFVDNNTDAKVLSMQDNAPDGSVLIKASGQLQLGQYTGTNFDNATPEDVLVVDASGNVGKIDFASLGSGANDGNGMFDDSNNGQTWQVAVHNIDRNTITNFTGDFSWKWQNAANNAAFSFGDYDGNTDNNISIASDGVNVFAGGRRRIALFDAPNAPTAARLGMRDSTDTFFGLFSTIGQIHVGFLITNTATYWSALGGQYYMGKPDDPTQQAPSTTTTVHDYLVRDPATGKVYTRNLPDPINNYISNVELSNGNLIFTGVGDAFDQTIPLPVGANNYVNGIAFDTDSGVLTLSREGLSPLTQDLDGRYALLAHTHVLSEITDVTATASEVNLLDISAESPTAGQVIIADGTGAADWGTLAGSQITNDVGWITSADVDGDGFISNVALNDQTHILSFTGSGGAFTGNINLSPYVNTNDIDFINSVAIVDDDLVFTGTGNAFTGSIPLSALADGNDIDFISSVAIVNDDLVFTGTGNAFTGSIPLSAFGDGNDNDIDFISSVAVVGDNLVFTGTGNAFTGNIPLSEFHDGNDNDIDFISNVELDGNELKFTGTGNAFTGSVPLSSLSADTNFAEDDLTLSGNRLHTFASSYMRLREDNERYAEFRPSADSIIRIVETTGTALYYEADNNAGRWRWGVGSSGDYSVLHVGTTTTVPFDIAKTAPTFSIVIAGNGQIRFGAYPDAIFESTYNKLLGVNTNGDVVQVPLSVLGGNDYISNVEINGNELQFTGEGSAFTGNVILPTLADTNFAENNLTLSGYREHQFGANEMRWEGDDVTYRFVPTSIVPLYVNSDLGTAFIQTQSTGGRWRFGVNSVGSFIIRDDANNANCVTIDLSAPTNAIRVQSTGQVLLNGYSPNEFVNNNPVNLIGINGNRQLCQVNVDAITGENNYISNVSINGNILTFTGVGNAFSDDVTIPTGISGLEVLDRAASIQPEATGISFRRGFQIFANNPATNIAGVYMKMDEFNPQAVPSDNDIFWFDDPLEGNADLRNKKITWGEMKAAIGDLGGDGIYGGSGTVPAGTVVTIPNQITFDHGAGSPTVLNLVGTSTSTAMISASAQGLRINDGGLQNISLTSAGGGVFVSGTQLSLANFCALNVSNGQGSPGEVLVSRGANQSPRWADPTTSTRIACESGGSNIMLNQTLDVGEMLVVHNFSAGATIGVDSTGFDIIGGPVSLPPKHSVFFIGVCGTDGPVQGAFWISDNV